MLDLLYITARGIPNLDILPEPNARLAPNKTTVLPNKVRQRKLHDRPSEYSRVEVMYREVFMVRIIVVFLRF